MAVDALSRMSIDEGSSVLIPTNTAVLDIDAGTLAVLGSEGGLDSFIANFIFPDGVHLDGVKTTATATTSDGVDVTIVREPDGDITIGNTRLLDERHIDGLHVLVVDRLFSS